MLINFLTSFGTFLALGGFLDSICGKDFSSRVASFVFMTPTTTRARSFSISQLSRLFIENTIFRFFNSGPFSFQSFLRSAILSVIVFCVFGLTQYIYTRYNLYDVLIALLRPTSLSVIYVILFFITYLLVDWVSFIQTYYFMRYAVKFRSIGHITFIAYADLLLSINIFVFLFPIALTFLSIGYLTNPIAVEAATVFLDDSHDLRRRVRAGFVPGWELTEERFDRLGQLGFIASAGEDLIRGLTREIGERRAPQSVEGNVIRVRGVFRRNGLGLEAILNAFVTNGAQLPEAKVSGKMIKSTMMSARLRGGETYAQTLYLNPKLNFVEPGNIVKGWADLYTLSFASTQMAQYGSPEAALLDPLEIPILFPWRGESLEVGLLWFDDHLAGMLQQDGIDNPKNLTTWEVCEGRLTLFLEISTPSCTPGAVGIIANYPLFGSMERSMLFLTKIPFAPFLMSSLCVTLVFYMTLYVFLMFAYTIKGVLYLVPPLSIVIDTQLVRRHAVWVVFTLGGFIASVVIAVVT